MLKEILHVGLTVSDMDKSIAFYKDILGLTFMGEIIMEGKETDLLFNMDNVKARVSYLKGSDDLMSPPIELIQFVGNNIIKEKSNLFKTSISEICFKVDDIDKAYNDLLKKGVKFLSEPQYYDFTKYGFSKSKAVYFLDPDEITLELIETVD